MVRRTTLVSLLVLLSLLIPSKGWAEDYFVAHTGSDDHDGLSPQTAFRTIQRGVDALSAGDRLHIGPGEYPESVRRAKLGDEKKETVIRATIPGTVLLRGDALINGFEKVSGSRWTYAADLSARPSSVVEADRLILLDEVPSAAELEFRAGAWYFDPEKRKLMISTSDFRPAAAHRYRIGVIPEHGLFLDSPTRVVVEGIGASGFHAKAFADAQESWGTKWGMVFRNATRSALRNCTAYLNGGGLSFMGGKGKGFNVIEGCRAYANGSANCPEGGNIIIFRGNAGDVMRGNDTFLSPRFGQRFYISNEGGLRVEDSLSWGNGEDFSIKGIRSSGAPAEVNRIVSYGNARLGGEKNSGILSFPLVKDSFIGGKITAKPLPPEREKEVHPGLILLSGDPSVDLDAEFANPAQFDFRPQSTSRFAETAGRHRASFPYSSGAVYFVGREGSDTDDGQSVGTAWRTLAHAFSRVGEGDTLYLLPGTYAEDVSFHGEKLSILQRGDDPVVVSGNWRITGFSDVSIKRMIFTGELSVGEGRGLELENCAFIEGGGVTISSVDGYRITHGVFTGPLRVSGSRRGYLAGNVFASSPAVEIDSAESILYSGYNSYPSKSGCWLVDGDKRSLQELQGGQEHDSIIAKPEISRDRSGLVLSNQSIFNALGPMGTAIGLYSATERLRDRVRLRGPFLHSRSGTTADIEWFAPVNASIELAWGDTPDCTHRTTVLSGKWGSYSLTGLVPGKRYYYRMNHVVPEQANTPFHVPVANFDATVKTFVTEPADATPRTYYVATTGDDNHSGREPGQAWRSISHAASRVQPGDTVLIAGGRYSETVRIRATGTKEKPITFRGMEGQRVVLDPDRMLGAAFFLSGKHHLHLDHLYFGRFNATVTLSPFARTGMGHGVVTAYRSNGLRVTRCLSDGRGTGYQPIFLSALECGEIVVRNCVIASSFNGVYLTRCDNARFEKNVFLRNLIAAMIVNGGNASLSRNIFTDNLPSKAKVHLFEVSSSRALEMNDNFFHLRMAADQRVVLFFVSPDLERLTLPEYYRKIGGDLEGLAARSRLVGDPGFAALSGAHGGAYKIDDFMRERPGEEGYVALDFPMFFATNPDLIQRSIGLDPAAFKADGLSSRSVP